MKKILIVAKPGLIAIDPAYTVVIVVDMQNDFSSKAGLMDRQGTDISLVQKTFLPIAKVLASARQEGIKIIYLKMAFLPDLSDLGDSGSPNRVRALQSDVGKIIIAPNGKESRILIRDTWNTDIVSELEPHSEDIVIYKHRYSGFYQTDLDTILKKQGIKNLIITGCTTSVCVESTVRDAMFRDYSCVVLEDCTAEPIGYGLPRSNKEASLLLIQRLFGWVSSSDEFIKALKGEPSASQQKYQ